jgi:hypothetical protein
MEREGHQSADATAFALWLRDSGQRVAMTSRTSALRAAALGVAFFALAGLASAQEAWHTLTGPEDTFTADLPATPKYTAGQAATPAGVAYTTHQYQVEHGGSAYVVQFVVYPKDVVVADPQWVLQQALDRTAAGMDGGKWTSTNFTKLKGALSLNAVGQRGGSEVRSHMVLKGRQLFTLVHIGAPGSAGAPDTERFVTSLKIAP